MTYATTTPIEITVTSTTGFSVWNEGHTSAGYIRIDGTPYIIVQIVDDTRMLIAQPKGWIAHLN